MAKGRASDRVSIGTEPLESEDLLRIAAGAAVHVAAAARARMAVSRAVLLEAVDRGDAVYGSTRRLGAGADDEVGDQEAFQVQAIRNHAGGIGEPVQPLIVRAAMATRLAQFALGGAGARPQLADALAALLNAGIVPLVSERGSVGMADLALNAAVAEVLVGEGAVLTEEGRSVPGAQALSDAGLKPLALETHEALSLLNTNAFTIGSAALLDPRLESLAAIADRVVALSLEAAAAHRPSGDLGPYSSTAHDDVEGSARWQSAFAIREALRDSFLHGERERRTQDELSFRCAPQVHGALADTTEALLATVDDALTVRPENPLVDVETRSVVPNGNFAAPELTFALEATRLALTHVARVSARRTAVLSALARPLRAAGRAGIPGLLAYSGAEQLVRLQQLAVPVSLGDVVLSEVEDYATWGWTAAQATHEACDLVMDVLAIEALHAASLLSDATEQSGQGTARLRTALVELIERGGSAEELVLGATDLLADDLAV